MRVSSQRHLASARGSSLLTWLPRPGRGAQSPPGPRCRPAPVSRFRLPGDVFDPPWLGILGGYGSRCAAVEPRQRGWGVGRVWGSSRSLSSLGGVIIERFSPSDPPGASVPPVPRARAAFPGVLPHSRRCVRWQCCSAREALLSPGSPSRAPGHPGERSALVSSVPQCWCWEPTRACQPWVALGRCCRAFGSFWLPGSTRWTQHPQDAVP